MGKLVAIAALPLALLGGAAAGHFLRPAPAEAADHEADAHAAAPAHDLPSPTVAKLRDGFIVPVLRDGQVWSHVILSLGIQSDRTTQDAMFLVEPLLRDGLNEALFLHGSLGGFDGDFTAPIQLDRMRERLDSVLRDRLHDETARVLIVSMARQSA